MTAVKRINECFLKSICPFLLLSLSSTAAEARGVMLAVDIQVSHSIIMLVGVGSSCITFTYDANGNRTAQGVATVGAAGVTWGGGAFGCFLWAP
jgi:hypothetical protein